MGALQDCVNPARTLVQTKTKSQRDQGPAICFVLFNMSCDVAFLVRPRGPRLDNQCQTTGALPASSHSNRSDDSVFEFNKAICFPLNAPMEIQIGRCVQWTERISLRITYMGQIKHILSIHFAAPHLTGYSLPATPHPHPHPRQLDCSFSSCWHSLRWHPERGCSQSVL